MSDAVNEIGDEGGIEIVGDFICISILHKVDEFEEVLVVDVQ
jgi:hypothetical protein